MTPASRPPARMLVTAAREAGFDEAGVTRLESLEGTEESRRLGEWIAAGRHGAMGYMERTAQKRTDPGLVLPGARSVLSVAMNYGGPSPGAAAAATTGDADGRGSPLVPGRIASYARGRDYHKTFAARLKALERRLREMFPGVRTRRYVDTGPVLEKFWAERAGIGWRGKHTNLVSRRWGSWLLLGEILMDLSVTPSRPETDHCGTCTRCLDACPTGALTGPYELDATRCISYLTIELRGTIPKALRPLVGDHLFGCDDCLEVCPWNRFARPAAEADFAARAGVVPADAAELVTLDEAGFLRRFAGTALMRVKREGLARNACVVLGNSGRPEAAAPLAEALQDPSPVVREHAAWALGRIPGEKAREVLRRAVVREPDPEVLVSLHEALERVGGA